MTKDSVVQAVCFSPEKHAELRHLKHVKSPVKLQNFGGGTNSNIFILKQTKIAQIPTESLGYAYSENMCTSSAQTKIANLHLRRVAPEQLVSLTVEVAHVAPMKTINTQYGSTPKKQELVVRILTNLSEDKLMLQILESQKVLIIHHNISQNKIIDIEAEPSV